MKHESEINLCKEFVALFRQKSVLWKNISTKNISQTLHISLRKVHRILLLLKKYGGGFVVKIDFRPLGLLPVFITITPMRCDAIDTIAETIKTVNNIEVISTVWTNEPHLVVRACLHLDQIPLFVNRLRELLNGQIKHEEITLVASTHVETGEPVYQTKSTTPCHVDATDAHIIHALREDATQTLRELGDKVRLSAPAVHARLKHLTKSGIIRGYSCFMKEEVEQLSRVVNLCLIKIDKSDINKLIAHFGNDKRIQLRNVYEIYGENNLLVETSSPDLSIIYYFITEATKKHKISSIKNQVVMKQRYCYYQKNYFDILEAGKKDKVSM